MKKWFLPLSLSLSLPLGDSKTTDWMLDIGKSFVHSGRSPHQQLHDEDNGKVGREQAHAALLAGDTDHLEAQSTKRPRHQARWSARERGNSTVVSTSTKRRRVVRPYPTND